ncbi:hypothetical protein [Thermus arciformis]|uniref:hypothetical protein n=1 Tax=Thermus arciformis TaxID=482827 RepID=UPI000B875AB5|nr:hypothetical protein [Thermus arciformis]
MRETACGVATKSPQGFYPHGGLEVREEAESVRLEVVLKAPERFPEDLERVLKENGRAPGAEALWEAPVGTFWGPAPLFDLWSGPSRGVG